MTGFNRVVLVGNLTRDPQLRQIPSGISVADIALAANETYKNREGKQVETTCFVDIVAWGRQAETCGQYLAKGSPILVEGRLQLDQWETKEGQRRSKLRVKADRVRFLGRPRRDAEIADAPANESSDSEEPQEAGMPF